MSVFPVSQEQNVHASWPNTGNMSDTGVGCLCRRFFDVSLVCLRLWHLLLRHLLLAQRILTTPALCCHLASDREVSAVVRPDYRAATFLRLWDSSARPPQSCKRDETVFKNDEPLRLDTVSTACLYSMTEMLTTQADRFSPEEVRAPPYDIVEVWLYHSLLKNILLFLFLPYAHRWNRCLRHSHQM